MSIDNEAPTFGDNSLLVSILAENVSDVASVIASDSDDGDVITYSLLGADAALFTVDSAGNVSFIAAPDFETPGGASSDNSYDITVVATDSEGLSASRDVFVVVTDANEVPVFADASPLAVNITENNTVVATVVANDVDAADSLTYSLAGADAALFTVDANGNVSFIAGPDFENPGDAGADNVYDVTVVATDAGGLSANRDIVVTVGGVNEAPIFANNSPLVAVHSENSTSVATVAAVDADAGDSFAYSLTGEDAALFAVDASGNLSFIDAPNYESAADADANNVYKVTVVATDVNGLNASRSVFVVVANANEAPVFADDFPLEVTLAENTNFTETVVASDVDANDVLTYSLTGADAALFTVDAGGNVSFIDAPNFEAAADAGGDNVYDVTAVATDTGGLSVNRAIVVTVNDVNEAPVFADASPLAINLTENIVSVANVVATDEDAGDTVTYSLTGVDAALFNLDINGDLSFIAAPNYEVIGDDNNDNIYEVTVVATDTSGLAASQDIAVTITNANEVPVFADNSLLITVINENTSFVATTPASDVDLGDVLTYSVTGADAASSPVKL